MICDVARVSQSPLRNHTSAGISRSILLLIQHNFKITKIYSQLTLSSWIRKLAIAIFMFHSKFQSNRTQCRMVLTWIGSNEMRWGLIIEVEVSIPTLYLSKRWTKTCSHSHSQCLPACDLAADVRSQCETIKSTTHTEAVLRVELDMTWANKWTLVFSLFFFFSLRENTHYSRMLRFKKFLISNQQFSPSETEYREHNAHQLCCVQWIFSYISSFQSRCLFWLLTIASQTPCARFELGGNCGIFHRINCARTFLSIHNLLFVYLQSDRMGRQSQRNPVTHETMRK